MIKETQEVGKGEVVHRQRLLSNQTFNVKKSTEMKEIWENKP